MRCIIAKGSKLFAGSSTGFLYSSIDSGSTWTKISAPYTSSYNNQFMKLFADGSRLFASTGNGFYYTDNDGITWTQVPLGTAVVTGIAKVGYKIFITTNTSGLYVSINGGVNFTQYVDNFVIANGDLTNIYTDSKGSIYITEYTYVGFHYLYSNDTGASWQMSFIPEVAYDVISIGNRIFTSSTFTGYFSDNNWNTHQQFNISADASGRLFKFFYSDSILYMYYNYGIFLSNDSGVSWNHLPFYKSVNGMIKSGNRIYISSGAGIFYSSDKGFTWTKSDNGINEITYAGSLEIGNMNYVATKKSGLFSSTDGGLNWKYISSAFIYESINTITKDNQNNIYVLVDGGMIYRSSDLGSTWNSYNIRSKISSLNAISCMWSQNAFYITDNGHFLYKTDSTFSLFQKYTTPSSLAYTEVDPTHVFALTSNGIYTSIDSGQTWLQKYTGGGFASSIDYYFAKENNINAINFIGTIYYSFDNGNNWNKYALTGSSTSTGIVINNGVVYAGGSDRIFTSTSLNYWTPSLPYFNDNKSNITPVFVKNNNLFFFKTADGLYYRNDFTGIKNQEANQDFSVYPNPFTNNLSIQTKNDVTIETVKLFDFTGKEINISIPEMHSTEITIDATNLKPGIYFMMINGVAHKIVKE